MEKLTALLILVICVTLNGCQVESEQPLTSLTTLPIDSALIGVWIAEKGNETSVLNIGNSGDVAKIIDVEISQNGSIKNENFEASVAKLNGIDYLSLRVPQDDHFMYIFLKYMINADGTLSIWAADFKFVSEAVENGVIAGSVNEKAFIPHTFLSADSKALQDFISSNDQRIFVEKIATYKRASLRTALRIN